VCIGHLTLLRLGRPPRLAVELGNVIAPWRGRLQIRRHEPSGDAPAQPGELLAGERRMEVDLAADGDVVPLCQYSSGRRMVVALRSASVITRNRAVLSFDP
jgi:hypothetical protein